MKAQLNRTDQTRKFFTTNSPYKKVKLEHKTLYDDRKKGKKNLSSTVVRIDVHGPVYQE